MRAGLRVPREVAAGQQNAVHDEQKTRYFCYE